MLTLVIEGLDNGALFVPVDDTFHLIQEYFTLDFVLKHTVFDIV